MAVKVFRTELNPVDFLERAAFVYPHKVALVHAARRYTYAELGARAWRLANALRDAGLGKGERVATLLPNSPAMLEAHFGVPAAGGVLVTVNTRLSTAEVGYILEHSGARFLLLDAELAPLVDPIDLNGIRVIRVDDTGAPDDPYEQFLARWPRPNGRRAGSRTRRRRSRSTTRRARPAGRRGSSSPTAAPA